MLIGVALFPFLQAAVPLVGWGLVGVVVRRADHDERCLTELRLVEGVFDDGVVVGIVINRDDDPIAARNRLAHAVCG